MKNIFRQVIARENGINKSRVILILLLLLSLALIFSFSINNVSAAAGDVIYVNGSSGNDSWDGQSPIFNNTTGSGPKLSIGNATETVNINGIIHLANGQYNGTKNTNITINKNMSIIGESQEGTIINGTDSSRIFIINAGVSVFIQNLTLTNGKATDGGSGGDGSSGGAIYNSGSLTLTNVALSSNSAGNGGNGASGHRGTVTDGISVNPSKGFSGRNGGSGGAIYNTGNLTIINTIFSNNKAGNGGSGGSGGGAGDLHVKGADGGHGGDGGSGGAIYNSGILNITNTTFSNNTAGNGGNGGSGGEGGETSYYGASYRGGNGDFGGSGGSGGAIYNSEILNITNTTFSNNTAGNGGNGGSGGEGGDGGAGHYSGGNGGSGGAILYSTNGNGGSGGAIYNSGLLTINSTIFSDNTAGNGSAGGTGGKSGSGYYVVTGGYGGTGGAGGSGGAIYNSGTLIITDMTFTNNNGGNGGNGGSAGQIGRLGPGGFTGSRNTDGQGGAAGLGGAIYNSGNLIITDTIFSSNNAGNGGNGDISVFYPVDGGNGGAVYNNGNLNITNSTFLDNNAGYAGFGGVNGSGGAIFNFISTNCTVIDCTFTCNNAIYGGAISNLGVFNINKSTFSNNDATNGAVLYNNGTCTITNINFNYNSTEYGAFYNIDTLNIFNSIFYGCNATYGGVIYNNGTLNITNSSFLDNNATYGGVIYNNGTLNITNSSFLDNNATYGGVIYNKGIVNVIESNFAGNNGKDGGVIYNFASGICSIIQSAFTSNRADNGGVIYNTGTLTVTSCNFINNNAIYDGGAIFNIFNNLTAHFNRFYNNTALNGNALYNHWLFYGKVNATNNWWGFHDPSYSINGPSIDYDPWIILKINVNPDSAEFSGNSTVSANLNYNSNDENLLAVYGQSIPDVNVIFDCSSLGSLYPFNGIISNGLTATTKFTAGLAPGFATVFATVDGQRVNHTIEIYRNDFYVATAADSGNDSNDGSPEHPFLTLNKAISEVRAGGRIHVANGLYNGPLNRGLTIDKNVTIFRDTWISGTGNNVTIDAQLLSKIFFIQYNTNLTLQNLTLRNGKSIDGGAIWNNGTLTITECAFTGNDVSNEGGAIYNRGILYINSSNFFDNFAYYYGGAIFNNGTITQVIGCNFINNTIFAGSAGAIYNNWQNGGNLTVHFSRILGGTHDIDNYYGSADLDYNWWGSNENPLILNRVYSSNSKMVLSKWIILNITANPTAINNQETSNITADFNHYMMDSGTIGTVSGGHVPDGIPITFNLINGPYGTLTAPLTLYTKSGLAYIVFTANSPGIQNVNATVDNQKVTANITINPVGHVKVTKTVNNSTPNYGNSVIFTIIAHNEGPDEITGLQITDLLPAGLVYISDTSGGLYNTTSGVWKVGTLANGANAILNITVLVNTTGIMTNWVNVTAQDAYDPKAPDNASVSVYVPSANVVMTKTSNGAVTVGNTGIFTIKITNNGPDDAYNVKVHERSSFGFTASWDLGNYDGLVWTIPVLANGQTAILNMTRIMTDAFSGQTITNTASETQDTFNPTPVISQTASIYVPGANVVMTKTSNNPVNVGHAGIFTITVTNNGPSDAHNVIITEGSSSRGFTANCDLGSYDYVNSAWIIPTLANGQTATLIMTRIMPDTYAAWTITSTSTETQDTYNPVPVTSQTASIYVLEAKTQLTETSNGPVNVGSTGTFTIKVHNNGPDTAHNVVINDVLPDGFNINSYSQGSFNGNTWHVGDISSGSDATLIINGLITPSMAGKTITNTATGTQDEYTPFSQTATASIYVLEADLSISKTVNNVDHPGQTINYKDHINYTITVHNNGPDAAQNVAINDKISNLLTFNPASVTSNVAFTYDWDNVNRIFTAYLTDPLDAGATAYLYLPAQVLAHAQNVNNTANVTTITYDPTAPDIASTNFEVPAAAYVNITNEFRNLPWGSVITSAYYNNKVYAIVHVSNSGPDSTSLSVLNSFNGFNWTGTYYVLPYLVPDIQSNWIVNDTTNVFNGTNWNIPLLGSGLGGTEKWLAIELVIKQIGTVSNYAETVEQSSYPYNGYASYTANLTGNVTPTNLTVDNASGNKNKTVTLKAVLKNYDGNPLSGRTVEFMVDGVKIGENTTDADGLGIFDYVIAQMPGNHAIEAIFNGDTECLANNGTGQLYVPQADLYIKITSNKNNPKVGEKFTLTYKLGNYGPDAAENVTITFQIPKGLDFINISADNGKCTYDPTTKIVTWTLDSVPVGDPYLYLTVKAADDGTYKITPNITSDTYDQNTKDSGVISINIQANNNNSGNGTGTNTVKASTKTTIGLQKTGLPLNYLILAILMIVSCLIPRKK